MMSLPANPNTPGLTCREVLDFLMAYLDDELAPRERREFERHLAACPSCMNYLRSYQATIRLGKAAMRDPEETAVGSAPESLIRAVQEARFGRK